MNHAFRFDKINSQFCIKSLPVRWFFSDFAPKIPKIQSYRQKTTAPMDFLCKIMYNCIMKVYIGYQSALEYWRIRRTLPDNSALRKRNTVLPNNPPTTEQVRSSGLTLPLHILLNNRNNRWKSKTMKQHVFSGETPVGFFLGGENELEVSSPELCFLQMAGHLPLAGLIELGYELCGTYSMPMEGDPNVPLRGFYQRQPMTNIKKLSNFAARLPGVKGQKNATYALRYILENSASPMETKLSIILTLPYRLGGFAFSKPKMNMHIVPSKTEERFSGKAYYTCDLFWPDHDLAVEYDSDLYHTGSTHIADDSKKRNTLTLMGITVITVTTQQFYNNSEFEKVVRVLAKRMGKRLEFKKPDFAAAHSKLRNQLLKQL